MKEKKTMEEKLKFSRILYFIVMGLLIGAGIALKKFRLLPNQTILIGFFVGLTIALIVRTLYDKRAIREDEASRYKNGE